MQIIKSTNALRLSIGDCEKISNEVAKGGSDIGSALVRQAANNGFRLARQRDGSWLVDNMAISDIEIPYKYRHTPLDQYVRIGTIGQERGNQNRQLNSVRTILKGIYTGNLKNDPAIRLSYQVTDLVLLKYAMSDSDEADQSIYTAIDACIEGFIWLYKNGGTATDLPGIINRNMQAKRYYESFTNSWSQLQNYMRTHMYLMDT